MIKKIINIFFLISFFSFFFLITKYYFSEENNKFRFVPNGKNLNNSRLLLLQALSIVIRNGMSILGVTTPSRM